MYIYIYICDKSLSLFISPCISKEDDSYWNKSPKAGAPPGNADATPYYSPSVPEIPDTLVDEPPQVPPADAPDGSGTPAEAVEVPGNQGTELADEDNLFNADAPPPPIFLSEQAADQRLRRIMTPKSDGSYKVPVQMVEQYKKNKNEVKKMFERCGHDRDCG